MRWKFDDSSASNLKRIRCQPLGGVLVTKRFQRLKHFRVKVFQKLSTVRVQKLLEPMNVFPIFLFGDLSGAWSCILTNRRPACTAALCTPNSRFPARRRNNRERPASATRLRIEQSRSTPLQSPLNKQVGRNQ